MRRRIKLATARLWAGDPSGEVRGTAEGLVAGVALQASLLVTGVVAARALGVDGRGELALLLLVPQILMVLGTLGVPAAIPYFMARSPQEAAGLLRRLRRTAALQMLGLTLLGVGIIVAFVPIGSAAERLAAALIVISIPARVLFLYGLSVLQGRQEYRAFNSLRVLPIAIAAVLTALLLAVDAATLASIVAAWTAGFLIAAGLALWLVRDVIAPEGGGADGDDAGASVREVLSFGLRGVVGWASPVTALRLDQLAVALFLTPAALGIFVTAQAFTNLPRFLTVSVGMVAYPAVAAESDPRQATRIAGRFFWFNLLLSAVMVGVLALAVEFLIPLLFGAGFDEAIPTARLLLAATMIWCVSRMLMDEARGLGLPGLSTVGEVTAWAVLIPGLALATPAFGLDGVAVAMIISFSVGLLVMLIALHRRRLMPAWRPRDLRATPASSESG